MKSKPFPPLLGKKHFCWTNFLDWFCPICEYGYFANSPDQSAYPIPIDTRRLRMTDLTLHMDKGTHPQIVVKSYFNWSQKHCRVVATDKVEWKKVAKK